MITTHQIYFGDSEDLHFIPDESIDLVITSPPYPMIKMWDEFFRSQFKDADSRLSFELMHRKLDKIWAEIYRVLKQGSIACLNIGDATRTVDNNFQLYSNHSRILNFCLGIGFQALPEILWRKQTNAPNKFMGSGMLPAGAYVTLEHEYILLLRKDGKRSFETSLEKLNRARSAFFWEERNTWFSDIWYFKGIKQDLKNSQARGRSGAFPFELAYRLVNMFSVKGDMVLDPFLGTGTTMLAAMASARNCIGAEINPELEQIIRSQIEGVLPLANTRIGERLEGHLNFVQDFEKSGRKLKHSSRHYGFPVMTSQEIEIMINYLKNLKTRNQLTYEIDYIEEARLDMIGDQLILSF